MQTLSPSEQIAALQTRLAAAESELGRNVETETALRENRERLTLAIEAGELGTWDWDLQSGEIAWNDRHFWLQGYAIGEVPPSFEAWLARVHPDDRDTALALIDEAKATATTYSHEYRTVLPDGSIRWCAARGRFLYDDAGEPYRMAGVLQDVTQRVEVKQRLRESEAAEVMNQQRLQDLQAELAHVARVAAMNEMGTALAHELNQPLAAAGAFVHGVTRLVARDRLDKAVILEGLGSASDELLRAGDIIRRLREFVAKRPAQRTAEPLSPLVREAAVLSMVGGVRYGLQLDYRFLAGDVAVLVDRVQIQQVIVNLMRNAAEAMSASHRRELTLGTAAAPRGMVRVSVSDTGPGVPPETASRLFQPFSTTKVGGMGVGLSISRTIIEAHGGELWHEPNPGGGAVFSFTVPAVSA